MPSTVVRKKEGNRKQEEHQRRLQIIAKTKQKKLRRKRINNFPGKQYRNIIRQQAYEDLVQRKRKVEKDLEGYCGYWKYIGPLNQVPRDGEPIDLHNKKLFKWVITGPPGSQVLDCLSLGVTHIGFGPSIVEQYPPEYEKLGPAARPSYRRYR